MAVISAPHAQRQRSAPSAQGDISNRASLIYAALFAIAGLAGVIATFVWR